MAQKVKAKAVGKVTIKKNPVKAGSTHRGNTGGVFNAKVAAIARVRKRKNKKNG